jgi:hypothetical protein
MNANNLDDDTQYRVDIIERFELLGNCLCPGQEVILLGSVLKTVADKVSHAYPV